MKILWLSHFIPFPPKGGVLQRGYNLIYQLSQYHEIDLLAFNQRSLIKPLFNNVEVGLDHARFSLAKICRRLEFFDITLDDKRWGPYAVALKSIIHEPYNINWLKSERFANTLTKWLKEDKYDLIHFDTISLLPFYNVIPPTIATSLDHHNIESHMLLRRAKKEKNIIKKFYYWQEGLRLGRYERRYCKKFSINITCSNLDRIRLQRLVPETKVVIIPNGVDLEYFKPVVHPIHDNSLVFVGSMGWYPNIEAVLYIAQKIWPRLKQLHQDLRINIVGKNPPDVIRAFENKLPDFHVRGFVEDVRPFIDSAAAYLCPVQDGGGTKLKILDAMAMKKAVVAHPVACEGINVCDEYNIILANTPRKFIEKIDYLLCNHEYREALGNAARELIGAEYDYKIIGKKLSAAFQNCFS